MTRGDVTDVHTTIRFTSADVSRAAKRRARLAVAAAAHDAGDARTLLDMLGLLDDDDKEDAA